MNRTISSGVAISLAMIGIFACGEHSITGTDGNSTDDLSADAARIVAVGVSFGSSSIAVGDTTRASATITDNQGRLLNRAVTWSSSNTGVATVSTTGLVTGVAEGNAVITAARAGKTGSGTITVTTSVGGTGSPPSPPPTGNPGGVTDLRVVATESTKVTLSFTQVNDGTGQPAKYDVRYAVAPISWGAAGSVTSGSCTTPLAGTGIGTSLTCDVLGLTPSTSYNFQLVAFRGTLNQAAVFGPLSNVASGTTKASQAPPPPPPPPTGSPEPGTGDVILWQDDFNKGTQAELVAAYAKRGVQQLITNGHSGNAIRFPYTAGSWDNLIEHSISTSTDVYFRYYYRLSPGADPTCGGRNIAGFKWFMPWRSVNPRYTMGVSRLIGGPAGFENTGLEFSSHDNSSSAEPNPFMQNINKSKTFKTTADGAWHEYTLHVVTGNGGYEQIWVDGLLVLDNSSYYYDHSSEGISLFQFPGPMVGWYSGCEFTVDIDDLVIWRK